MTNVILVSNTEIINKIFSLVSNKLAINLQITNECNLSGQYDMIFIDEEYLDQNLIQLKSLTDKFVLISSSIPEVNNFDYSIQKPFLPSKLQNEIEKIIEAIPAKSTLIVEENKVTIEEDTFANIEQEDGIEDLVDFVDNMFEDITQELDNNEDESIITQKELGHGGVLDKDELSKLFNMVNNNKEETALPKIDDEEDWVELADIIDKAIDDVATYEFEEDKPIKLILNQYSMDELKPLFQKLNQNIIDKLTNGEDISLQLRLEK